MGLLQSLRNTFGPDSGDGISYRCTNCGRRFVYRVAFEQPDCPYCDSTAVERTDGE
jgi:transposase-like protein